MFAVAYLLPGYFKIKAFQNNTHNITQTYNWSKKTL